MSLAAFAQLLAGTEAAAGLTACPKCNGGGRFKSRSGRDVGPCFTCGGSGMKAERAPAPAPVAARAPAAPAAPAVPSIAVDASAIHAAFDRARESGLKRIRITLRGITVKPAPAGGKNPGALYVTTKTDGEGVYLGKIVRGGFERAQACTAEQADEVAKLVADPATAAKAYGVETGNCAICGLELTDPESIARGIGPICAERFAF